MSKLADFVLADAILIPPHPPTDTDHQYNEGKGSSNEVRKLVTEKTFTSLFRDEVQLRAI